MLNYLIKALVYPFASLLVWPSSPITYVHAVIEHLTTNCNAPALTGFKSDCTSRLQCWLWAAPNLMGNFWIHAIHPIIAEPACCLTLMDYLLLWYCNDYIITASDNHDRLTIIKISILIVRMFTCTNIHIECIAKNGFKRTVHQALKWF